MKDDTLSIPDHLTNPTNDPSPSSLLSPTSPSNNNNNGYHVRQYKTSQVRLEVDRALPVIVDGELMDPPEGAEPLTMDIEVLRGMCYIIC